MNVALFSPSVSPFFSRLRRLFHPILDTLCLHFRSEGRVEAERRQSEGRVEASSVIIIPKKPKIRVPLLRKKVAYDDNNNNNRYETSVPSLLHSSSHIAR